MTTPTATRPIRIPDAAGDFVGVLSRGGYASASSMTAAGKTQKR